MTALNFIALGGRLVGDWDWHHSLSDRLAKGCKRLLSNLQMQKVGQDFTINWSQSPLMSTTHMEHISLKQGKLFPFSFTSMKFCQNVTNFCAWEQKQTCNFHRFIKANCFITNRLHLIATLTLSYCSFNATLMCQSHWRQQMTASVSRPDPAFEVTISKANEIAGSLHTVAIILVVLGAH